MKTRTPKLRNVEKYSPKYPLNKFPAEFAMNVGKEIVYILATRPEPRLEGNDWEEIFARSVGAKWTPSNVGLDDVVFEQTAWGAKTVKNARPFDARHIRLICGRNSLDYSYGDKNVRAMKVGEVGEKVLDIWNARLADVRKKFLHVRTVVLLKGEDLREVSVYEEETCLFEPRKYYWQVNDKGNFEGFEVATGVHRFTWQPHGSQFTVISDVPKKTFEIANQTPHTGFSKCRAEGCGI